MSQSNSSPPEEQYDIQLRRRAEGRANELLWKKRADQLEGWLKVPAAFLYILVLSISSTAQEVSPWLHYTEKGLGLLVSVCVIVHFWIKLKQKI